MTSTPRAGRDMPLIEMLGERAAGYVTVDRWSSRTSRLQRLRAAPAPPGLPAELVLKVCAGWDDAAARTTFRNGRRMAALVPPSGHLGVLELLAWSAAPPAVVGPFVPGDDLGVLLGSAPGLPEARVTELISWAGELLGHLHAGLPVPAPRRAWARPRRVFCAGDFALYNLRLDDRGTLHYMEPPAWERAVSPHRDLAWFLSSLRSLAVERRRARALRRTFLAGYRCGLRRAATVRGGGARRWSPFDDLGLLLHRLRRRRGLARAHAAGAKTA